MTAAPLKFGESIAQIGLADTSPRSNDRGPIEVGIAVPLFFPGKTALRGQMTAAPLKSGAEAGMGRGQNGSPRSNDRGPIEVADTAITGEGFVKLSAVK